MLYVLNLKKGIAHMSIYAILMNHIFKMKLPTLDSLREQKNAQVPNHLNHEEFSELAETY